MLKASAQHDTWDPELGALEEARVFMQPISRKILSLSNLAKRLQKGSQTSTNSRTSKTVAKINAFSKEVNTWVSQESRTVLEAGKILGILGGDHSAPFGALEVASKKHRDMGVLHLDAHFDLRRAYQGFTHSHASIFYNVMTECPSVSKLVQVGIRDFSQEEFDFAKSLGPRSRVFFDQDLVAARHSGRAWNETAQSIVQALPEEVWVSFDIDGLDPRFCPNTGTPVPGGLDFDQAVSLLRELVRTKRKIIGFDLCEVAPGKNTEWNENVGMRLLWKMCGFTRASQRR